MRSGETYLGDGLYASIDEWGTVQLRTTRVEGDHYVYLEPQVLAAFEAWIEKMRQAGQP